MEIRRIRADEGLRLRALRLRALSDSPTAYGSTLASEELYRSPFGMREPQAELPVLLSPSMTIVY